MAKAQQELDAQRSGLAGERSGLENRYRDRESQLEAAYLRRRKGSETISS